jgi:hypothetical protein
MLYIINAAYKQLSIKSTLPLTAWIRQQAWSQYIFGAIAFCVGTFHIMLESQTYFKISNGLNHSRAWFHISYRGTKTSGLSSERGKIRTICRDWWIRYFISFSSKDGGEKKNPRRGLRILWTKSGGTDLRSVLPTPGKILRPDPPKNSAAIENIRPLWRYTVYD